MASVAGVSVPYTKGSLAVFGPHVFYLTSVGGSGQRLIFADLRTGRESRVAVPLASDERLGSIATDGHHLAALAWRRPGGDGEPLIPCPSRSDKPIVWRVLVWVLDSSGTPSGAPQEVDRRESRLVYAPPDAGEYCAGAVVPMLAAADGRLTYAVEDPSATRPSGSRVLVRDLGSGQLIRSIQTRSQVIWIAISATSVAWAEGEGLEQPHARWWLMKARIAGGSAGLVNLGRNYPGPGGPIALDGDVVYSSPSGPLGGPFRGLVLRSDASGTTDVSASLAPANCRILAAGGGVSAMGCTTDAPDAAWQLDLWLEGVGLRVIADAQPDLADIGGGWLVWVDGEHGALAGFSLSGTAP